MTTKENILQQSLILFAQKGYDGVSVREIARAVGIRESALYKHYKNKEDIFIQVVEESKKRITDSYMNNQVPEIAKKDRVVDGYREMTLETLCEVSWNLFCLYTKDPMVSNLRKLLMREQFSHPEIADQYSTFFLDGAVEQQSRTFGLLVQGGVFRNEDPKIIALHFYAPIFLLFQLYDCKPQNEDAIKEMLFAHVKTFRDHYSPSEAHV